MSSCKSVEVANLCILITIRRDPVPIDEAFKSGETSGVTLENIAYCTEYDLKIHLQGLLRNTGEKNDEIISRRENIAISRQYPSQFVKPQVNIQEGYTNLTCSAR